MSLPISLPVDSVGVGCCPLTASPETAAVVSATGFPAPGLALFPAIQFQNLSTITKYCKEYMWRQQKQSMTDKKNIE